MELQDIFINYSEDKTYSLFNDVRYSVANVSNSVALKSALDSEAGFTVTEVVVQYTEDRHYDVPRIVLRNESETNIIALSDISVNLNNELLTARTEIEADITNQISE